MSAQTMARVVGPQDYTDSKGEVIGHGYGVAVILGPYVWNLDGPFDTQLEALARLEELEEEAEKDSQGW